MGDHRVFKVVKALGQDSGLPELHPHAFRHSCGMELLRRTRGNLAPDSRTSLVAYFGRKTARGVDHELDGFAGRTRKQLLSSWREAVGRDKTQEHRAADDAAAADMAVVPGHLGRELLVGESPVPGR